MNEFLKKLQEARNAGDWLEARLHLMFTEIADGMFGDGRLTREERIALSGAIGRALDAFRTQVKANASQLYSRDPYREPEVASPIVEAALDGEFIPLLEKAIRRDGTTRIKLIQPGWGASGYYPAAVLERDGPSVFGEGTQMFWNHATPTEEVERPEGDLHELAAVLASPAAWEANGPAGPGLYADARVFEGYQPHVDELAPHIGVSIRATGRATQGEADGRTGSIIEELTAARSVDFVTKPGAGGQIVEMFEAARGQPRSRTAADTQSEEGEKTMTDEERQLLQEAHNRLEQLERENARLREAQLLSNARTFVQSELATVQLPDVTKARLVEDLGRSPVVKDDALDAEAFRNVIQKAVAAEQAYLQEAVSWNSGQIAGMGGTQQPEQPNDDEIKERLRQAYGALGLSEAEVEHAVEGRGI